jgi:hypothetical protein
MSICPRLVQDPREVHTKFGKSITTDFFSVGDEVRSIVEDWVGFLITEQHWGPDDPMFPATRVASGADQRFAVVGLEREHWSTATPIRAIFT